MGKTTIQYQRSPWAMKNEVPALRLDEPELEVEMWRDHKPSTVYTLVVIVATLVLAVAWVQRLGT